MVLLLLASSATFLKAESKRPPRPEKIEEVKSDRPSEYHTWISGRWKWKRKEQSWIWQKGHWRFDHDLYAFKNRYRYYNIYHPRYWRYALVPLGRGYYRIVRY